MKNFKKFIKNNKFTIAVMLIFILVVVLAVYVYSLLVPSDGKATYGGRLEGKDSVKITEETYFLVKESLLKEEIVSNASTEERGKRIDILIEVKKDTKVGNAKELSNLVLSSFSEEELKYYDFQIFIKNEDLENTSYPVIGYKHSDSSNFSWTKDR